jgi:hypothetical protein
VLFFRGVFNIVCCVFDNSVVFNDTVAFRSFAVRWFVRSLIHSRSRSFKGRHVGAFGRWRGSRYQPTEGQVCQLASSYSYTSYLLYRHL